MTSRKRTICNRGHRFYKWRGHTVCPKCYPGFYKKHSKSKVQRTK